jgi:hypothetical protein
MKILAIMFLGISSFPLCGAPSHKWPLIQPTEQTARLELPNIDAPERSETAKGMGTLDVIIKSQQGDPTYKIECGTPDRSRDGVFEYSGDFQCRMILWGIEVSKVDLLSEMQDRSHDWQSRARFFASEVSNHCGAIPEFGRLRNFRLRGMKISLEMSDIHADESGSVPTLTAFTFKVSVVPDTTATSNVAQAPEVDPKWRALSCSLDDSVPVHFRR